MILFIHPVVVLQSEGPHVGEIRGPSLLCICHLTALTERKPHLDCWCMSSPSVSLLLCGSKRLVYEIQIIKDESSLNASGEAAGDVITLYY